MATEEQINGKVKERMELEQNLNFVTQRMQQFQNELQNLNNQRAQMSAQLIKSEGWFDGAEVDYLEEKKKNVDEKSIKKDVERNKKNREGTE